MSLYLREKKKSAILFNKTQCKFNKTQFMRKAFLLVDKTIISYIFSRGIQKPQVIV